MPDRWEAAALASGTMEGVLMGIPVAAKSGAAEENIVLFSLHP